MSSEPNKPVESTAHRMATRLDVLAAAMFTHAPRDVMSFDSDRAEHLATCYRRAAAIIAELDRLNTEKPA